ncbi:hypothetical protein TKK_0013721 [Trichogramma kaykai]
MPTKIPIDDLAYEQSIDKELKELLRDPQATIKFHKLSWSTTPDEPQKFFYANIPEAPQPPVDDPLKALALNPQKGDTGGALIDLDAETALVHPPGKAVDQPGQVEDSLPLIPSALSHVGHTASKRKSSPEDYEPLNKISKASSDE